MKLLQHAVSITIICMSTVHAGENASQGIYASTVSQTSISQADKKLEYLQAADVHTSSPLRFFIDQTPDKWVQINSLAGEYTALIPFKNEFRKETLEKNRTYYTDGKGCYIYQTEDMRKNTWLTITRLPYSLIKLHAMNKAPLLTEQCYDTKGLGVKLLYHKPPSYTDNPNTEENGDDGFEIVGHQRRRHPATASCTILTNLNNFMLVTLSEQNKIKQRSFNATEQYRKRAWNSNVCEQATQRGLLIVPTAEVNRYIVSQLPTNMRENNLPPTTNTISLSSSASSSTSSSSLSSSNMSSSTFSVSLHSLSSPSSSSRSCNPSSSSCSSSNSSSISESHTLLRQPSSPTSLTTLSISSSDRQCNICWLPFMCSHRKTVS
jgi:hypothetical protein